MFSWSWAKCYDWKQQEIRIFKSWSCYSEKKSKTSEKTLLQEIEMLGLQKIRLFRLQTIEVHELQEIQEIQE